MTRRLAPSSSGSRRTDPTGVHRWRYATAYSGSLVKTETGAMLSGYYTDTEQDARRSAIERVTGDQWR
jgi:hypothetical protein